MYEIPDLPRILVGDIDHRTRIHLVNLLRDMQNDRYKRNDALEKYKEDKKKKRDAEKASSDVPPPADVDEPPSKKRLTVAAVMSEQSMFQEEHFKLVERVGILQARLNKTIRVLIGLQRRFDEHVSLDSNGATPVASITLSAGSLEESTPTPPKSSQPWLKQVCLACNKRNEDCKCFDDL